MRRELSYFPVSLDAWLCEGQQLPSLSFVFCGDVVFGLSEELGSRMSKAKNAVMVGGRDCEEPRSEQEGLLSGDVELALSSEERHFLPIDRNEFLNDLNGLLSVPEMLDLLDLADGAGVLGNRSELGVLYAPV